MSEVAIGACDLAEVLGSAVALNLLFHIPLLWAVIITGLDVLLLLALQQFGMRTIEAIVVLLIATISVCYFIEIFVLPETQPSFLEMGRALVSPHFRQAGMLYVAVGIIGATVMPHNLYLHSALVQSRKLQKDEPSMRRAVRFNTIDSTVALTIAFFVNAAILVLAAMVFFGKESVTVTGGQVVTFKPDSDWIRVAYLTLAPLLGTAAASTLFAVALLASGQSSTITGTLAGQVVMEGFMHWRIKPWVRRLITRTLAILPAVLIIGLRGDSSVTDLLILSQVVLALQLPFAMFPLLQFTSSRKRMGSLEERLVPADGWLGQCYPDHRDGRLRLARLAQGRVAGHRRRITRRRDKRDDHVRHHSRDVGRHADGPGDYRTHQTAREARAQPFGVAACGRRMGGQNLWPGRVSPEIAEDTAYLEKVRAEFQALAFPPRRNWPTASRRRKSSNGCSRRAAIWWR